MKTVSRSLAAIAALTLASAAPSAAFAEAHEDAGGEMPDNPHFSFTGSIEGAMIVGGVGGEVFGGAWSETLSIGVGENAVTVTSKCIGMDQPDNSLFDRHFTCSQETTDGESKGAVLYGCNVENEQGNEMSCYGYFEGKEGGVKDRVALETAYYWFLPDGSGKVVGGGQWIK